MASLSSRDSALSAIASGPFDLLVVGGGVTGAGIALDAALRGLRVALAEKQDFAAGTSSRSTKLIHGGLRYLKQLEFALVREVGLEREIVHRNAPHIVLPEKMLLPIIRGGSLGRLPASVGLYVYDVLAGVRRKERRVMMGRDATMAREPLLREEGLIAGALYWEYRTDDARLVMELLKTAAGHGAVVANYCQLDSLIIDNGRVAGGNVTDLRSGSTFPVRAKRVVNAAGPWVDKVRGTAEEVRGKRLRLTKGVHIVASHDALPIRQAVYFDTADGRMVFAIPRDGCTYIGTTDTFYEDSLERPRVSAEDAQYLLDAANLMFLQPHKLTMAHILSSWAGLRPLIHEDGKSASELSRKDEIFVSAHGLISIAGGKLTGYRKMAERTVDLAMGTLAEETGTAFVRSTTAECRLSGSDISNANSFLLQLDEDVKARFGADALRRLYHRYGSNAMPIIQAAHSQENEPGWALALAELDYGIAHEMVTELSDFLIRRTGMLYFEKQEADRLASALNAHLSERQRWDSGRAAHSLRTYQEESRQVLDFV